MRKPDLCFFHHVVDKIGDKPSRVIMLDDRAKNICATRSVGIHGFLVDRHSSESTGQILRNLFVDPLSRVERFVKASAGNLDSTVEGQNIIIKDDFSQLLIWELTGDADIV
jgi:methionine salvage enolase-phosphatase E1